MTDCTERECRADRENPAEGHEGMPKEDSA